MDSTATDPQFLYRKAYPRQSEQEFVRRAALGDLEVFNQLVELYQDRVYQQAYWLLGDEDAAEDAAQEAFYRAYDKFGSFRGPSFLAWILRITTNHCFDRLRRCRNHPETFFTQMTRVDEVEAEPDNWLPDQNPLPEKVVERRELSAAINGCLMAMKPSQRLPIILVDIQGINYQEAAQVMGMRMGTFKSCLSRARVRLVALLTPYLAQG